MAVVESDATVDEYEYAGPTLLPQAEKPAKKKRKVLPEEGFYLSQLPSTEMYEKSFMHRDTVTHVVITRTEFVVTASVDGYLKFWKKIDKGIEFVKTFKAHVDTFSALVASQDGLWLASSSCSDKTVKVFDVVNFDMVNIISVHFDPCCMIFASSCADATTTLLISDAASSLMMQLDAFADVDGATTFSIHKKPVLCMAYLSSHDGVISVDSDGVIEYWSLNDKRPLSGTHPSGGRIAFKLKIDTDLYTLAKEGARPVFLQLDLREEKFAIYSTDGQIRVFNVATGNLVRQYDESLMNTVNVQQIGKAPVFLDDVEFGRRLTVEKDMEKNGVYSNFTFDDSGNFLLFATMYGIKVINLVTNGVCRIIGKEDCAQRFVQLSLYQGSLSHQGKMTIESMASSNPAFKELALIDPLLICTAYKKNRFYLFTRRGPNVDLENSDDETRDVLNEKPAKEDLALTGMTITASGAKIGPQAKMAGLAKRATIYTDQGDIMIELMPDVAPKAVENFTVLAQRNYYNGVTFHRVVKGFMIQTGDPTGTGAGGESMWGRDFEDEIRAKVKHDKPYTVSMANSGMNTNGSQFFITVIPCPWLDGKHTIFARVVSGMETVHKIEHAKVDPRYAKPFDEIKIVNIHIDYEQ